MQQIIVILILLLCTAYVAMRLATAYCRGRDKSQYSPCSGCPLSHCCNTKRDEAA